MKFILPTGPRELFSEVDSIKTTWQYRWATRGVFAQLVIGGVAIALFWQRLPPGIPLWYSKPWGEERLTQPVFLWLPLVSSILIYFTNMYIVKKIARSHLMYARVLYLTSLLVSLLSLMLVLRIITLVI